MMKSMLQGKRKAGPGKKRTVDYRIPLADYHANHDKHLCKLVAGRNMKTAGVLAKNARYICFLCGRAAKNKSNLCEPVEL